MPGDGANVGEANPAAKLTWMEVREIRSRYALGRTSQKRLADLYGVCQSLISRIVNGERWVDGGGDQ
jgi:hypothetical protein